MSDFLDRPIHGYATDEVNRSRSMAYMVKIFRGAAGLGRRRPPAGSTFAIPAKVEGRYNTLLKFEKDRCIEMKVRELHLNGKPPRPRRGGPGGAAPLVIFTERAPKFLP